MAPDFRKVVPMGKNSIVRDLTREDGKERNRESVRCDRASRFELDSQTERTPEQ